MTAHCRARAGGLRNLLVIGIGGSALGPQFVANALGQPAADKLEPFFFDNTDPDGMEKVLARIGDQLGANPLRRHFKIRRDAGDTQRHVGGQGRL